MEKEGNAAKEIHPTFGGEITVKDLEKAFSVLKNRPQNPEAVKRLLEKIDHNKDGKISVEELEAYADALEALEGVGEVPDDAHLKRKAK